MPVDAAIVLKKTTPEQIENIPMQILGDTLDQVRGSIKNLDAGVETDLQQKDIRVETDLQLQRNVRELERAHQIVGTMSGQIKASTATISVLDEQITQLTRERDRIAFSREDGVQIDEARITEINNEIKELREQRDLQQEHLNRELLPSVKSQVARTRETVNTILYSDRILGKKIQTLFREQGITFVSIITAIGFAISRIVSSIAFGIKAATPNPKPKPGPKPKPDPKPKPTPDPTPGSKEWIKNMLEKTTNIRIKLGDKTLFALPGIIGAVLNFVLKSAASAVGFVAENMWTLNVAVGGLLYYELKPALIATTSNTKSKKTSR